jgi:hypothetical protein
MRIASWACWAGLSILTGVALAQDEGEPKGGTEPSEPSPGDVDVDALMKSMDLGPASVGEGDYVNEMSYEGHLSQAAPGYKAGVTVTISHTGGAVTVRCQEQTGLTARLAYTIYGTNSVNMERFGKAIGLSAFGSSSMGNVKTRMPPKSAGITRWEVPLTVNLPPKANVIVVGGAGWVQVDGCEGTVKVSNTKDGVVISGTHSLVNVSSGGGDVKVHLTDGSTLKGTSSISSKGSIDLQLPTTYDGKFSAKGSLVRVFHTVNGPHSDTAVSGTVGSGTTATLNLSAMGNVDVTAPQ